MGDRLKDKRIIVTGGGSGLGKAIALRSAEQGAKVLITARRAARLEATAKLSDQIHYVSADLTSEEGPQNVVEEAVKVLGGIDVLVNNSGIFISPPIEETPMELYDKLFNVNVRGLYRMTRAALPELRKGNGPNIINMASIVGLIGIPNVTCYSATKGAVIQITRSLAAELGPEKIRVNCVCPGLVRTELTEEMMKDESFLKQILPNYALGRFGVPDDVAHACVYLASDEAAWLTGVVLPVDGGYTAL
ncbi:MAG: Dihydroanticapsin 7-dehydrogenase [bacterium]|nr:Dihydroanticapsin 7-dehydrogenase [bacterium]